MPLQQAEFASPSKRRGNHSCAKEKIRSMKARKATKRTLVSKLLSKVDTLPTELRKIVETLEYEWIVYKDYNSARGARGSGSFLNFVKSELALHGWTRDRLESVV